MDTSKKYIEMCEKAVDIQKKWKPEIGDFYRAYDKSNNIYLIIDNENLKRTIKEIGCLWLPRQDQLQKIPNWSGRTEYIIEELRQFHIGRRFKTMEQMWLEFIMLREYRSYWNGIEWIKRRSIII